MKVCERCKIHAMGLVARNDMLAKELAEHGITQAIAEGFVDAIGSSHDEVVVHMILPAFVVMVAKSEFPEGAEAVCKRFVGEYMRLRFFMDEKLLASMKDIVPEDQCQWHHMFPSEDDEDSMGDDGPVPPDGTGPSMFG